jgi:excisionase family DNA binding protein
MIRVYREPPDPTYSLSDAAVYLGIAPEDLTRLASRRRIASYRSVPGAAPRFHKSDLDAWRLGRGDK